MFATSAFSNFGPSLVSAVGKYTSNLTYSHVGVVYVSNSEKGGWLCIGHLSIPCVFRQISMFSTSCFSEFLCVGVVFLVGKYLFIILFLLCVVCVYSIEFDVYYLCVETAAGCVRFFPSNVDVHHICFLGFLSPAGVFFVQQVSETSPNRNWVCRCALLSMSQCVKHRYSVFLSQDYSNVTFCPSSFLSVFEVESTSVLCSRLLSSLWTLGVV